MGPRVVLHADQHSLLPTRANKPDNTYINQLEKCIQLSMGIISKKASKGNLKLNIPLKGRQLVRTITGAPRMNNDFLFNPNPEISKTAHIFSEHFKSI